MGDQAVDGRKTPRTRSRAQRTAPPIEEEDELVQLNVRLPKWKVQALHRVALARNVTATSWVEDAVTAGLERERETIRADFERQRQQAIVEEQEFLARMSTLSAD